MKCWRANLSMSKQVMAQAKVFGKDDYTWQARELYQGQDGDTRSVNFAALTQTKHHIIEGGQYSPITLTTQFDYDQHGNKTLERHLGRSIVGRRLTALSGNTVATSLRTLHKTKVNYPIEKRIIDDSGTLIYKQRWLYDDESFDASGGSIIGSGY